ncbi:uncharacterized protein B0I36DRAFT_390034 [Microdochium trichocladiopsis]|uniref:NmrA-like domain-containing protein n=1 Tax=Microdochium trichocladiopsis TaxID=1682393 RepID=A0A9P9BHM5_9PEZI|nr:uncharacterized protein B0I36DRAFT_390034 [Microdochium trichocladiopsis]KAH7007930.1 hypothetical protein B0I36DRAFT_390034 [Microdochium trichocladiopsis]
MGLEKVVAANAARATSQIVQASERQTCHTPIVNGCWQGANGKANAATIAHTGEALAAALSLPEADLAKYKNSSVYAPSFYLTQREILKAIQRATGTTGVDWDIQVRDVNEVAKEYEEKISQGDGVAPSVKFFVTHFLEGRGGDFNHKVDAAELKKLEQLGLTKEDLDHVTKAALQ